MNLKELKAEAENALVDLVIERDDIEAETERLHEHIRSEIKMTPEAHDSFHLRDLFLRGRKDGVVELIKVWNKVLNVSEE